MPFQDIPNVRVLGPCPPPSDFNFVSVPEILPGHAAMLVIGLGADVLTAAQLMGGERLVLLEGTAGERGRIKLARPTPAQLEARVLMRHVQLFDRIGVLRFPLDALLVNRLAKGPLLAPQRLAVTVQPNGALVAVLPEGCFVGRRP